MFGDYTASAIASICFNEAAAVVDGNVYRVLARYFGISEPINTSKGFKIFKTLAQELISKKDPATFNQAIMEFGSRQCKPKNPDCSICPLQDSCVALKDNSIGSLPVKLKAKPVKKKYFNYMVIISEDKKTVLEQRAEKGIWQNLYQFPLIETKKRASLSEIKNKIKNNKTLNKKVFEVKIYNEKEIIHKLSHQHLYTTFWIISLKEKMNEGISIKTIHSYPVPILISNFIEDFNF